jgi:pimeloyl-ACP methyl ester carboxylesterase
MYGSLLRSLLAAVLVVSGALATGCAHQMSKPTTTIDELRIDGDLTLRRMVVRNDTPTRTVLFLHGFPETIYAWQNIAPALGDGYEVHAFDWPGYGLSSRPPVETFSYAPADYARVLKAYIRTSGIDTSTLVIYATDIGALPALLLALEEPDIARTIIVGDFAPFDRPAFMYESLQGLKSQPSAEHVRAALNKNRDEILANTFTRGLPDEAKFTISPEFQQDIATGWNHGTMTAADAFYHYYAHFTRDQQYFEANVARLKTPIKVVWGEKDLYINKAMGEELAQKTHSEIDILPGIGHYPHLQDPAHVVAEIRASFGD